jgi:acyl-coenzyme A synthetase/AMP-(fatty) acid ligase
VLAAHPGVLECAVVGRADEDGLTRPCAYVVAKAEPAGLAAELPAELMERCARQLPRHKRPRWVELVPELPQTATGKVQRYRLRQAPLA